MTVPIFLVVRWEYMGKENQFPETQVFQVEKNFWSNSVFKIHQPQKLIRMNTLPIKILASVASSKDKRFTSCKMFHKNLNWNVKLMVNWVVEIRMPWQTTNLSDLLFACWLRQLAKITKCAHKSYPAVNKHSRERQLFQSPIYNIYIYIHTHTNGGLFIAILAMIGSSERCSFHRRNSCLAGHSFEKSRSLEMVTRYKWTYHPTNGLING